MYAMTCVRERLEACLSIRPGRMSGRQDFLLAPYLPSGNLMAPVWTALTKVDTREDPGGVAASAVQALNALLRDHPHRERRAQQGAWGNVVALATIRQVPGALSWSSQKTASQRQAGRRISNAELSALCSARQSTRRELSRRGPARVLPLCRLI